jgi:hypothetical protein
MKKDHHSLSSVKVAAHLGADLTLVYRRVLALRTSRTPFHKAMSRRHVVELAHL